MSKVHIDLNHKTILVTGSPGFIGANLVMRLLKDMAAGTVISLDNMNDYYDPKLKEYRLKKAREKSVPAYVIFTDKALLDMCMKLPHSKTELLDVHGVGEAKCNQYGDDILEIIRKNG